MSLLIYAARVALGYSYQGTSATFINILGYKSDFDERVEHPQLHVGHRYIRRSIENMDRLVYALRSFQKHRLTNINVRWKSRPQEDIGGRNDIQLLHTSNISLDTVQFTSLAGEFDRHFTYSWPDTPTEDVTRGDASPEAYGGQRGDAGLTSRTMSF